MGRPVEVSLEAFGKQCLTAVLNPEELKGKTMEDIITMMVHKNWQGEQKNTLAIIDEELKASGGYAPSVGVGGMSSALTFQPVNLGDGVEKYIQDYGMPQDQLRVKVTGSHIVG